MKELKNKLTKKTILEYRRGIEEWAKGQGFEKIIFKGERSITENSTSAVPGKAVEVSVDLKKP